MPCKTILLLSEENRDSLAGPLQLRQLLLDVKQNLKAKFLFKLISKNA